MNIDHFWSIIQRANEADSHHEAIKEELRKVEASEIKSYQDIFDELYMRANRWEIWGAAYTIEGGCSDDGFIDFRYGLISRGKQFYETALRSPDDLADLLDEGDDFISDEGFGYLALRLYSEITGQEMERNLEYSETTGEDWDFDDEEETRKRLPKLWAKFVGDE